MQIAPTATGYASDTACVFEAGAYTDPNPSNDCATAKVTIDGATPTDADLAIVSNTPSVTHAKAGDSVTFTIVAKNNGPDAATLWVNTGRQGMQDFVSGNYMTCDGEATIFTSTASWCESGMTQPGQTVTETVVRQIAPTTASSVGDTACVLASGINDPNPSNDCATATINIDSPCPVGIPGAAQTLGNVTYDLEGEDTFTKSAGPTSMASTDPNQVIYTGDHGMGWTEYPDGWPSTNSGTAEGYNPESTQWVHGGVLDFTLREDSAGHPVGASISPLPGGNRYQTYGAWSFCERVPSTLDRSASSDWLVGFHQAPLLWPEDSDTSPTPPAEWESAESDFPESDLWSGALDFKAYAHYGGSGAQDIFDIQQKLPLFDPTAWHVYTQTWGPGFRGYYVDGTLIGSSTNPVWSQPERWQLQIEPSATPVPHPGYGDVWVKWVWIGTLVTSGTTPGSSSGSGADATGSVAAPTAGAGAGSGTTSPVATKSCRVYIRRSGGQKWRYTILTHQRLSCGQSQALIQRADQRFSRHASPRARVQGVLATPA